MTLSMTYGHRRAVHSRVADALADLLPAGMPDSVRQCRRIARRLGLLVVSVPACLCPHPLTRYDYSMEIGVLYLPAADAATRLKWFLHELAEIALGLERWNPVEYPREWGDHHTLATIVEQIQWEEPDPWNNVL